MHLGIKICFLKSPLIIGVLHKTNPQDCELQGRSIPRGRKFLKCAIPRIFLCRLSLLVATLKNLILYPKFGAGKNFMYFLKKEQKKIRPDAYFKYFEFSQRKLHSCFLPCCSQTRIRRWDRSGSNHHFFVRGIVSTRIIFSHSRASPSSWCQNPR